MVIKINNARKLDQFYTNKYIAKYLYEELDSLLNLNDFFLFEPSAGAGSFSDLFHNESLSIDVSPKKDYIKKQDFFDTSAETFKNLTKKKIITIGNPPFGKNSSLAIKFLNEASVYSSYVAFILPKTFKKNSVKNKINAKLHLMHEEDLSKNSFVYEENEYDVPCVFQVWKKTNIDREKIKLKVTTNLFDFTTKNLADLAIRRVGGLSGKVFLDFDKYQPSSHYFIKLNKNVKKDEFVKLLVDNYKEFQLIAKNTAGNPSLSKGEMIEIIEKHTKQTI